MDKGADYKAVDYEGKTALMYASLYGNTECAEIIINEDNFLFMNFADVDICDMNNYTALAYAIMANNVEICQLLLDKGADINHLVGTDQKGSLLELAIVCESDEVISLLIENGANVDYVDKEGISIADYAVINGNENALRILLRYNADINTSSPDSGFSPLLYSVLYDSFNMMNLLLSSGANIETVDNDGNNALHLLCMTNPLERSNQIEMAEVLLDKGINLDAYNKAQQTPLMLAIDSGNYEIAEFLIQNDANIALKVEVIIETCGQVVMDSDVKRKDENLIMEYFKF